MKSSTYMKKGTAAQEANTVNTLNKLFRHVLLSALISHKLYITNAFM